MIAPVKENPVARRRSPLQAARLAVADALLAPQAAERSWRRRALLWAWLGLGLAVALAGISLVAIGW